MEQCLSQLEYILYKHINTTPSPRTCMNYMCAFYAQIEFHCADKQRGTVVVLLCTEYAVAATAADDVVDAEECCVQSIKEKLQ